MMLHEIFASNKEGAIPEGTIAMLFATERKDFKEYDSIQAALPYLKLDWVKSIRKLNVEPTDFRYSEYE